MSVRAGLANVQRRDVGIRRAPVRSVETPPGEMLSPEDQQQLASEAERAKVESYNRFLQSQQFALFSPETQIEFVESLDLTPEQKAPVIESIKERVAAQKRMYEIVTFNPEEEIRKAPTFQTKYVQSQYAGTIKPGTPGATYFETGEGFKQLDWSKYSPEKQAMLQEYLRSEQYQRSLRLGLFIAAPLSVVAAPVAAGVGAGVSVGVSQAVKSLGGGGLLTPQEALMAAGEGAVFSAVSTGAVQALRLAGPGLKTAAGRVAFSTGLGAGIGTGVEYFTTGKITGAGTATGAAFGFAFGLAGEVAAYGARKVTSYYRGKAQSEIDAAYERQIRYNEAVLQGKVKGVTELWKPTGTQRFQMRFFKIAPRTEFAQQINVARIPGGDITFDLAGLKRVGMAGELWELGYVPKSALAAEHVPAPIKTAGKLPLHPVMFSWAEFKSDIAMANLNLELKQRLIEQGITEKGLPESQLAYDYRGETWWEKPSMEYALGKRIHYEWTSPFQQPLKARSPMKPFGEIKPETAAILKSSDIVSPGKIQTTMFSGATSGITGTKGAYGVITRGYAPQQWQGKPFYAVSRARGATMEEMMFLSVPKSGLAHPPKISALTFTGASAALVPISLSGAALKEELAAIQIQKQIPLLDITEVPTQIHEAPPLIPFTKPAPSSYRGLPGFKFEGVPVPSRKRGRREKTKGRKRVYPILIGEELLGW